MILKLSLSTFNILEEKEIYFLGVDVEQRLLDFSDTVICEDVCTELLYLRIVREVMIDRVCVCVCECE